MLFQVTEIRNIPVKAPRQQSAKVIKEEGYMERREKCAAFAGPYLTRKSDKLLINPSLYAMTRISEIRNEIM